jgi:hypothetical protein
MPDRTRAHDETPSTLRDYAAVRSQLRDGDVILFSGSGILSKLIEKCSHGHYSHSGIVAWWGHRVMLLQAEIQCVQAVPLSVAIADYEGRCDWWSLKDALRTEANLDAILGEAKADLGLPFGVIKLVQEGLHALIGISAPIDPKTGTLPSMFCSEYVGRCFGKAGITFDQTGAIPSPEQIAESRFFDYRATLQADKKTARSPDPASVPIASSGGA